MKTTNKPLSGIKHFFRVIYATFFGIRILKRGSKKLRKWLKKNKKRQDENLHDYNKRWEYSVKKMKKMTKAMGVKVNVIGLQNLPKGAFWMTPNHTSNFDGFYIVGYLGSRSQFAAVSRYDLQFDKKSNGYLIGSDSFFIDRDNLRQSIAVLNNAALYAKQNSRGICIFPEGQRSLNGELLEFKAGSFKFAQKYFLPIVPVSITGTVQARRWWWLKERVVTIKVHQPLQPADHSRIDSQVLANRVRLIIQKDIDAYYASLTEKQRAKLLKMQEKATKTSKRKGLKTKTPTSVVENVNPQVMDVANNNVNTNIDMGTISTQPQEVSTKHKNLFVTQRPDENKTTEVKTEEVKTEEVNNQNKE